MTEDLAVPEKVKLGEARGIFEKRSEWALAKLIEDKVCPKCAIHHPNNKWLQFIFMTQVEGKQWFVYTCFICNSLKCFVDNNEDTSINLGTCIGCAHSIVESGQTYPCLSFPNCQKIMKKGEPG